jgi:hypothetical protein
MTKNNLPKYSHGAYNSLLEKLERPVNLVKSIASENSNNLTDLKKKWVETSRKEINLKKVLNIFKNARSYTDEYKFREYKFDGNLEFKNKNIRTIRKLIEIEPRLIKYIYDDAKRMFNYIKDMELKTLKYERLYKLNLENNYYNKLLLKLEKEHQEEIKNWDDLNEYNLYPNDDYCPIDDYSEQEQLQLKLKHQTKITSIVNNIKDIKNNISNNDIKISNIFNEGIKESDIANTF